MYFFESKQASVLILFLLNFVANISCQQLVDEFKDVAI